MRTEICPAPLKSQEISIMYAMNFILTSTVHVHCICTHVHVYMYIYIVITHVVLCIDFTHCTFCCRYVFPIELLSCVGITRVDRSLKYMASMMSVLESMVMQMSGLSSRISSTIFHLQHLLMDRYSNKSVLQFHMYTVYLWRVHTIRVLSRHFFTETEGREYGMGSASKERYLHVLVDNRLPRGSFDGRPPRAKINISCQEYSCVATVLMKRHCSASLECPRK